MTNNSPVPTYNQYKVRKLSWNDFGEIFGITLPRTIGEQFKGVTFNVQVINTSQPIQLSGTFIVLQSGLDLALFRKEVDKYDIEQFTQT